MIVQCQIKDEKNKKSITVKIFPSISWYKSKLNDHISQLSVTNILNYINSDSCRDLFLHNTVPHATLKRSYKQDFNFITLFYIKSNLRLSYSLTLVSFTTSQYCLKKI